MTIITPKKILPPKTPGWSYNVQGNDGNWYGVKEQMAPLLVVGQPVEVEITTKEKDGRTFRDIKRIMSAPGQPPEPVPAFPQNGQAKPGSADDPFQKRPTNPVDAERMFCAGALNALLPVMYGHHHGLTRSQVADLVTLLRGVWSDTFGQDQQ